MSIQLSTNAPIDELLAALRKFKRRGEQIAQLLGEGRVQEAVVALADEEAAIASIEGTLKRIEQSYVSPDVAKKLVMIKRQFKDERERVARELHRARERASDVKEEQQREEEALEGFDFEVESRLLREKGESLMQVHKQFTHIRNVVQQTQQMTMKQGEDLDLVTDALETSHTNVKAANEHLEEANTLHKEKGRCCWWVLLGLVVLACIICLLLFIL